VDAACGVYSSVRRGAPGGIHPGRGDGGGLEFVPHVGGGGHARRVIPHIHIRNPRSYGGQGKILVPPYTRGCISPSLSLSEPWFAFVESNVLP